MKILYILALTLILGGCGWFGGNDQGMNGNNQTPNGNQTQNGNNQTNPPTAPENDMQKTSTMKDLFTYFDDQKISYSNAKDVDVVDMNAHEGKMFEYEGNPVYIYRMNMKDSNMEKWMNEIKNTGKVTIKQDGKEASYDASINGEYVLVSKSGTDLNKLKDAFNKYEVK